MAAARALVIRVAHRAVRRLRAGHPWIFRDDLMAGDGAEHGAAVLVAGPTGPPIAAALYSATSKIALRVCASAGEIPGDDEWRRRGRAAAEFRARVVRDDTDAFRAVFAESDAIPGLIVDRYAEHVVVQVLVAGAERIVEPVLAGLEDAGLRVLSVLGRNDPAVRTLEGLPREIRQLRGSTPRDIEVRENGTRLFVDPWSGQKTGAFLDQRDNRRAAVRWCTGTVLDVFSYQGWFAVQVARKAKAVVAVDSSRDALAAVRRNAEANGVAVETAEDNAFDRLRALDHAGERFDSVLLDPPAFAKNRRDRPAAMRGYKDLNLRAMRVLRERGILVTSSCSYHLGEAEFLDVVADAAADAGRTFRVLERRSQAPDHPVLLAFPESRYLKCLVLGLT